MAGFWPTADTDPSSTGPVVEFARIWRDMPKIVYSRTLERAEWNTKIVKEVVADEVLELKAQPGGDLVVGGADLAATFMRLDLVDEYRLYVHPVVIGRGKPLFPASDTAISLRLAETRTFGEWCQVPLRQLLELEARTVDDAFQSPRPGSSRCR